MTETTELVESTEEMRQHIEETKSQLWDKLDTLESQVSEVVQSTTTAVSETVASVQETVSNVTETVQESVQSVSDTFDLPLQVGRHPWIAVGGSFVLGYLAHEFLNGPKTECENEPVTEAQTSLSAVQAQNRNGHHAVESGQESLAKSGHLGELRGMLVGTLMSTVSAIASRSFSTALDYLAKRFRSDPNHDPVGGVEKRRSPK